MKKRLAFIGAGSMAEAIIAGVLSKKYLQPSQIYITNKENKERLERLTNVYGVISSSNKKDVIENADIVILSMKPKDVADALVSIKPHIHSNQLIISVLAGISSDYIEKSLEKEIAIIRAMPNTSATIGYSATAIAPGRKANQSHLDAVKVLFETIGTTTIVNEDDLHAVTGLSGSGPAYIYYLVEAMEDAALQAGLDPKTSKELIVQTLVGASQMLKVSKDTPSVLRERITSPGGTTQAGLETLKKYKYQEALIECIKSAKNRSIELGKLYE